MNDNRAGVSLLELAVILGIIGIISAVGTTLGVNAFEGAKRMATQDRLVVVKRALDQYAERNGYLPCPSRLDRTPTASSFFGDERRDGTTCIADGEGVVEITVASDSAFLGSLPTRALGLPDSYAGDGWGNKLRYVVSADHVGDIALYATTYGVITIMQGDRTTANKYAVTTNAAGTAGAAATYVVISTGPDAKGAWPMQGSEPSTGCGTSNNNDVENCDDDDLTFYDNDDVSYVDTGDANSFFDDYVVWGSNALDVMPPLPEESPIVYCPGATLNWTVAAVNCSTTVPGGYYTVAIHALADTNGATTGTASFECLGTGWDTNAEAAPAPTCVNGGVPPVVKDACSSGNCAFWCAPCENEPNAWRQFRGGMFRICEKEIISTNPCLARCTYAGSDHSYIMSHCP